MRYAFLLLALVGCSHFTETKLNRTRADHGQTNPANGQK
jgi:hypothetical protein